MEDVSQRRFEEGDHDSDVHEMVCVAVLDDESWFVCTFDSCGREIVIDRSRPSLIVLEQGLARIKHQSAAVS